ncbi:uncharacterized protein LOC117789106 [Drosophila innubila]|uniref:uncharacterized protein LOC117789106 n=1 Tax=Drosophila innubila TaxID=198719 RepID=UPI00148B4B30|nr:uncharacterized protein LOC117789106 [Drosophila innubila]
MKLDWSPEIERAIYKDWAKYYSRRRRENYAMHYYDKAFTLAPEDFMTLYYRSQCHRKIGKTNAALADCKKAQKIVQRSLPENYPINLEICDAIYELNQFENFKAEVHNNTRLFSSNKSKSFEDRLIVVDGNIEDTLGDGLSPFILENEKLINHMREVINDEMKVDERPLWKILKEQDKCDILSVPEIEEKLLSPREMARKRRAFNLCNQVYLDRSWADVVFLKNLRTNPTVLMEQCKNSDTFLGTLTVKQYEVIKRFLKMMHARSPMYFMRYKKYTNKALLDKFREALLNRVQYQTRRNMNSVLRTIRRLRTEQNLTKLSKYVEDVMGEYVVLKTNRIMPWKFEFLNEVYNTLALALAEQYHIPTNFRENDKNALLNLLHLDTDKLKDIPEFVFGDRSTYQSAIILDSGMTRSRRQILRLENRMTFARYSIEKCYLLHQIASIHLESNHYDECYFIARKAIEETKNCNSIIWSFLSTILIAKANASLNKSERVKEDLKWALQIAKTLDSNDLTEFVEMCISCNEPNICSKASSLPVSKRGSRASSLPSGFQVKI